MNETPRVSPETIVALILIYLLSIAGAAAAGASGAEDRASKKETELRAQIQAITQERDKLKQQVDELTGELDTSQQAIAHCSVAFGQAATRAAEPEQWASEAKKRLHRCGSLFAETSR